MNEAKSVATRAYKNLEKNYIYLVVTDESGLDRIEDEAGNVRMVFERE